MRGQELPTAYVHAKFEYRSFIRLRNIGTFRCGALIDPVTLTFDLEVGVGVARDLGYPCAKFRLPRPFGFRVRADVRDIRQTDRLTDRRTPDAESPITVTKQRVLRHYQQHHRGRRLRRLFCYEELSVSTQQNISRPGRFIDIRQRAIAVLCVLLVQRS